MVLPKVQMWKWMLLASVLRLCVSQGAAKPAYMVAIPAVIPSGSEAKLCASLLQPNETMVMTITLLSEGKDLVLFQETSEKEFHRCVQFQAPEVQTDVVQNMKVEVRGKTFSSTEQRKIMIRPYSSLTFVQTDKPIYNPGQKVHFRVVSLDTSFRPANEQYDIIELEDVNRNRIGQWVNTTSNGRILQLSHPLNSEAPKGHYTIIVSIGEKKINHKFKVEKYVLPKFDIKLKMEEQISIAQDEFKVEVCAMYTYGQPVPGRAEGSLCRQLARHYYPVLHDSSNPMDLLTPPCHKVSLQFDKTGCASAVFSMSVFTKIDPKILSDNLELSVKAEEEGTGLIRNKEKRIELSYVIGKTSFIETPKIYEHGTFVTGKVKVVHYNNTPIADKVIYLFERHSWSSKLIQNITTDKDGIAMFTLNTTSSPKEDIKLTASDKDESHYHTYRSPHFEMAEHTLSMIQPTPEDSKTVSFLNIQKKDNPLPCVGEEQIMVQYTLVGETVTRGSVDVIYLILSRGTIVQQGVMKVEVKDITVSEGEVSFRLAVSPDMAPMVQVLVYSVLPSETVIAHSMDFPTQSCFKNKVSVQFSPDTAIPGEESSLQLSAMPGSLCGLSAIDQSVLIMEPEGRLNVDKLFQLLPVTKADSPPYEVQDQVDCLHVRPRRYVMPRGREDDAYDVFNKLGLKMATNLIIRVPTCLRFKGREYHHGYVVSYRYHSPERMMVSMSMPGPGGGVRGMGGVDFGSASPAPIETVRTFFPETWIWDLVEVGNSGSADVPLTVPDTITTWETEAFCLSSEGLGLAPPLKLKVFQPFFLELSLPYSLIRGELFELTATVFNYLPSCIMVSVTPAPSLDYTLTPLPGAQYSSCLCANGRKTFRWTMDPLELGTLNVSVSAEAVASHASCDNEIVSVPERGRLDVVTRSLLVKAEGIEQTDTYNWLLCPAGDALVEEVDIQLPKDMIVGSARASLSVLGDILGRALQNLDGLLRMPYGCGEQNMALLAPNIYILEYLKNTKQLTSAIEKKATNFLTSGYQKQLNYKHYDGAYSTFGQGDGNTWLTAFVLRAFGRAKSFIYIDPQMISESKKWLEDHQKTEGSFIQLGKLFNNRMKGGVSDDVTLTAYITASLLELMSVSEPTGDVPRPPGRVPPSEPLLLDPFVAKSLAYLTNASSDLSNTYTTALLAYTFSLAGHKEARARLLQHLDKIASTEGGVLYWSQSDSSSSSLSVEISSYVLLATLSSTPVTRADLGYASRIVRWLVRQQNAYGGFSSTQDTVVALQALALYSTRVFSGEGSSSVSVKLPGGEEQLFDVNQSNKLLYQERLLKSMPGKYSLEVKGNACASVQLAVHYNIPTPNAASTLTVQAVPTSDCSSTSLRRRLSLQLKSIYYGQENTTNMVIVDIKMLSGFVPVPESLSSLKSALLVDRVETNNDHVIVYLTELLSGVPIFHSLDIIQELPVQKIKPAVVKIYDYYQPSDQSETEYIHPCSDA